MTRVAAVLALLLVAGCSPDPDADTPMNVQHPSALMASGRFHVTRNRRGIYVIHDDSTGTDYVGVSGVGIAEVGSHTLVAGKTVITQSDER